MLKKVKRAVTASTLNSSTTSKIITLHDN